MPSTVLNPYPANVGQYGELLPMLANGGWDLIQRLTLILLTCTIWRAPTNASKWRMGFNSAFKGLIKADAIMNPEI